MGNLKIVGLETFPPARVNPKAKKAIAEADLIILGPGDLYTSIICNLVVGNIATNIKRSKASKVFVVNLMTKFGQTNNFTAQNHINELEKYLGMGSINTALINQTTSYQKRILSRYSQEKAQPVVDDLNDNHLKVIRKNFVATEVYKNQNGDKLKRSLIRHDSEKLAKAVVDLL